MGLFDKLKPNKNNKDFFEWLDLILKNELNSEIKAINLEFVEWRENILKISCFEFLTWGKEIELYLNFETMEWLINK